jgi:type IV pilus assembly protein PilC
VTSFVLSPTGRFTRFRRAIDQLLLSLPITDRLSQQYASARVLSAAGMSVETGIPVTKALYEASSLAPNTLIEERIIRICNTIAEGSPFEEALEINDAFTRAETQIMICSSEAGDMAGGMTRMAKEAEEQVEATIEVLTSLVEPLILGVMSLVVGTVSLATFLPWVKLLQSIL